MAKTIITAAKLAFNAPSALPATVAIGGEGAKIAPGADHKTLLIIEATAAGKATVKAGTGIQGTRDLEITFADAGTQCVTLESGAFLQTVGEDKGSFVVTGSNLKAAAVVLP